MKYAHGLHFLVFCSGWIKIQMFLFKKIYLEKLSAIFQPMSPGLILLEMSLNISAVISIHLSLCINILGIHWHKGSIIKIRQSYNHIFFVMGKPTPGTTHFWLRQGPVYGGNPSTGHFKCHWHPIPQHNLLFCPVIFFVAINQDCSNHPSSTLLALCGVYPWRPETHLINDFPPKFILDGNIILLLHKSK